MIQVQLPAGYPRTGDGHHIYDVIADHENV